VSARRLLLWRHGRTAWNAEGRIQGQADVPLDAVGVRQAAEAAPLLAAERPDAILSSDLSRARATADALAAVTGLPVQVDSRLRESAFGDWQGRTGEEIAARWPEAYSRWRSGEPIGLPGVETPEEVADRVVAALDSTGAGTTVVVTHGGAARRGLLALLDWPERSLVGLGPLGNCRWCELRTSTRGWRLYSYNAGPLAGAAAAGESVPAADVEPPAEPGDPGVPDPSAGGGPLVAAFDTAPAR